MNRKGRLVVIYYVFPTSLIVIRKTVKSQEWVRVCVISCWCGQCFLYRWEYWKAGESLLRLRRHLLLHAVTSHCFIIAAVISPHGIVMTKGLYFIAGIFLLFSSFFFSMPYLRGHRTDLSQSWTHIHLWLLFEKFGPNSPGHFLPTDWGAKNAFWDQLLTLRKHGPATENDINNPKEICQSSGTPLHAPNAP